MKLLKLLEKSLRPSLGDKVLRKLGLRRRKENVVKRAAYAAVRFLKGS